MSNIPSLGCFDEGLEMLSNTKPPIGVLFGEGLAIKKALAYDSQAFHTPNSSIQLQLCPPLI